MTPKDNAGGPAGPASLPPGTPQHRLRLWRGAELDELILQLEATWKIGLKLRGAEWSPKKSSWDDLPDRIYGIFKRLFFSSRPALDEAIRRFEQQAHGYPRAKRMLLLYQTLPKRDGPVSRIGTPKNDPPKSLSSLRETSRSFESVGQPHNARHGEQQTRAAAIPSGSPTDEDTDEEYVTAPRSPSLSLSPSPSSRSGRRHSQASAHVSLRSAARKRPSDSSSASQSSPKLTKTSKGKQTAQSFMSGEKIPTPSLFKKPSLDMARSFQNLVSVPSSANTSFNQTVFSSQETANTTNTSFASHDGANAADEGDIQAFKSTRTSSTTMGSLDDHDLISVVSRSELSGSVNGVLEQDIQRDLNHNFPEEGSSQHRSTFGPIHEDGLRDELRKVESQQTKLGSAPPASVTRDSTTHALERSTTAYFPAPAQGETKIQPRMTATAQSPSKMSHDVRSLPIQNLFVPKLPQELEHIPYFILFICQRIALDCSTSLQEVVQGMAVPSDCSDAGAFWSFIENNPNLPPVKLREASRLWQSEKRQFDGYTFKGHLTLSLKHQGPVVHLSLSPVHADDSCRLQRMFGSDRFLYLNTPTFKSSKTGRFNIDEMEQVKTKWYEEWLLAEHSFLGRKWRVFYIEDLKRGKSIRRNDILHDKRIVLFATEGCGIEQPYSIGGMLNQFIPFDTNKEQGFCKAFARIKLGLSRTIPTIRFETSHIERVPDQFDTDDQEDAQFNDTALEWQPFPGDCVMDDGCCIISVGAARIIWQMCKKATGATGPLPSAFQGRIAGAKGLWMISAESFTKDPYHLDLWIKINDSQWKFNPPRKESVHHHRTFELSDYSSAPSPSELHISFIPILVDRGVPRDVIAGLMFECMETERKKLLELLPDSVKVYDWVHRNGTKSRAGGEVRWQAALPVSLEERLKLLLESGFSPVKFPYLAKGLERFIRTKHVLQEAKLRVPLAKSAFLFGVADPFGVLEPGEIQVQFSTSFVDETTDEKYLCLRDMEVLVARQPACRRSDIQKVRTVVHPELSHLVDVVVFPSKGRYPLAGKLQGGDYDGDRFWVCWESQLVNPFKNAPAPVQSPDPTQYGIKKETEKLKDIMDTNNPNEVDNFLRKAFEFGKNASLLGLVTIFAEKQAYSENRIFSPVLEELYDMHDLLVDAPKQGYVFIQVDFDGYARKLRDRGVPVPVEPSYKSAMAACAKAKDATDAENYRKGRTEYKSDNILDFLFFEVVRKHNLETMELVRKVFSGATEVDKTLLYPRERLNEKKQTAFRRELDSLTKKLEEVYRSWISGWHRDFTPARNDALVDECYRKYRAIQPDNPEDPDIQPLVEPHLRPGTSLWDTIKASALYTKYSYPEKGSFVFTMAGRELARLKSDNFENTRAMVSMLHANMKPRPIKAPGQYDEEENEEDEEDEFETALEALIPK
ncbi:hypothetical protein BDW02DRAFT_146045 [Decorospora gaudefroyi]|uniref:RNA-dependent RNA polymerase n=1 Tax=Decorospora gaudefroyi TaxID=184978 RepID=A0A6A5K051_9PLEO|nr:hypothetical protein BDW02DRAFT_146045 [Decorospora gaudefroyi]